MHWVHGLRRAQRAARLQPNDPEKTGVRAGDASAQFLLIAGKPRTHESLTKQGLRPGPGRTSLFFGVEGVTNRVEKAHESWKDYKARKARGG